jgi:hypothetical protein
MYVSKYVWVRAASTHGTRTKIWVPNKHLENQIIMSEWGGPFTERAPKK